MIKVNAAEFQRNIGRYQDMALTQPVVVTRNDDADIAALEATSAPESSKAFDHELDQ
ncbi:hypothetical protein [Mesorhizobium sp.]|uniref:hypothetical protein n=1 Tax=Mesorhizobium sp. TaxID=1871066 RepID=UPI00257AF1E0|nr:hypothetical protein [Mesorhizobium sp.]